ncbi:MAG: hypothetical protein CMG78_09505 [Marinobacter sp.]|nr:hypothetical protein [Marinobacter sp.]|tara:strand:- start:10305 stop:10928 length:624 start_codon:yes stop_codon:yes gene_type:complete
MTVPYLPLYIADYQADTSHLTTVEHGAYLLLIMNYWQRGKMLPADDRKLARIAGLGPREWNRIKGTISEFFEVSCSGWLHRRLESELSKLRDKSLKKRKGGLARAQQMHSERSARGQLNIGVGEDIPSSKEEGAAPDSDKAFWDNAKAYLGAKNAPLIGKWVKTYGKEEAARAITASQLERAVDPVPFIVKALQTRTQPASLDYGPC